MPTVRWVSKCKRVLWFSYSLRSTIFSIDRSECTPLQVPVTFACKSEQTICTAFYHRQRHGRWFLGSQRPRQQKGETGSKINKKNHTRGPTSEWNQPQVTKTLAEVRETFLHQKRQPKANRSGQKQGRWWRMGWHSRYLQLLCSKEERKKLFSVIRHTKKSP